MKVEGSMAKKKDAKIQTCPPGDLRAAAIAHYKIAEFARLEAPALIGGAGGPMYSSPGLVSGLLAAINSFSELLDEFDEIKDKIQRVLDVLQPPDPGELDMPVPPPTPPTPATTRLRQILAVLRAAKTAAENLEPESARDSLREAKDIMRHETVRQVFRDLKAGRSWYDILEELQDAIDYLDNVSRV
jgi:hypothetical protein